MRNKRQVRVLGLVGAAVVVACTGEVADPSSPAAGSSAAVEAFPCDVDAVLAQNCRRCHASPPLFGAPMPLVTLADLKADAKRTAGKKVYEVVGARIHDDTSPMPQPPYPRLGSADMATLDNWIADGAPAGGAACTASDAGVPSSDPTPLACTPDQLVRPTSKWAVTQASDEYVCYGFDVTNTGKRHVIAGGPHIDQKSVVHHVLLYQADESVSGAPAPCTGGGRKGWRLVSGWAPGGKNFELPPEAGFAEDAGVTHWVLQIHYNNAQALTNISDETGYDLCSTDQLRPNDADILATGTYDITIPPRSTHSQTCEMKFPANYGAINVVSSWAHMHRLGRAEYARRVRGGVETPILDAPTYDFNTGAGAQSIAVDLQPGDVVRTMCKWQNTGDDTVSFGEGTADEMCFAFLTYWPKITAPKFVWSAPALPIVSKCTPETTAN